MPIVKRIVCLANSRKRSGRCIAGKELVDGQQPVWIRPVSDREDEEVSARERQYEDGSEPRVLDIIDVPLLKPQPNGFQKENWLLDSKGHWTKVGQTTYTDLPSLTDSFAPLWINGHKTYHGLNNKVPVSLVGDLSDSLRLIRVNRMRLSVLKPSEAFGDNTRRVHGFFRHAATEYRLRVTDPVYEQTYLAQPDGDYEIGESFLTISLTEPFNGDCYKLIATIIQRGVGITA